MVETSDRFTKGHLNTKLFDDTEWKLDLNLFVFVQKKYEKYQDAWIDNRAQTYNLVLQNCPPRVKAELKNQLTWTAGQDEQNVVTLLIMIRIITHNMRESKQGFMAIVECAVEMNTTDQKSSKTTEECFDIFEDRRNTVNTHNEKTGYHEVMFKKAMIKIMDEMEKTTAELDGDPVLKKEIEEAAMNASSEEFLVCLFILLTDIGRYKGLKIELENYFTMEQLNYPNTVVANKRLLTDYIAPGKSNCVKQEPYDTRVAFSDTDRDNDCKKNVSCHGCGLKGHQLNNFNKTSPKDKKRIYAMKKAGTFESKKTGFVNSVVKGTPGDDDSAALSVTISGSEHDQYQRFLGVCGEYPVELFNIGEEDEFDEDDAGFAFYFCNISNIDILDVEDDQTLSIWMIISDVAKVGGVTFAESHWKKQGRKSRPTNNMITPDGQHAMEGTALINRKGNKRTLRW